VKYEGLPDQASKQKKKIFNKLTKSKVSLSKKKKEKEKKELAILRYHETATDSDIC